MKTGSQVFFRDESGHKRATIKRQLYDNYVSYCVSGKKWDLLVFESGLGRIVIRDRLWTDEKLHTVDWYVAKDILQAAQWLSKSENPLAQRALEDIGWRKLVSEEV